MRQCIRGRVALGVLGVAGALVVLLAVSSTGTAARGLSATGRGNGAQKPRPSQHISGVVPASRSGHKPKRSDFANTPFATVDNLTWHGGPVMHTNKVYAIYWVPPSPFVSVSPNYKSLIDRYFADVAAASGSSSNVYASDTQYSDGGGNILYSAATPDTFAGSVLDTNPLPPDGCLDFFTDYCLSDAQLQAEIQNVAAANGWTPSPTTIFVLMTGDDIGSCIDDGSSGVCAFEYYCAYHSNLGTGPNELIYANIPYADFLGGAFCDAGEHPNGDDADASINLISHEHNEAITDPNADAWYDSTGAENGDKCAWDFGTALGSTASGQYNQLINGHPYMLQQEWSNASSGCVLTYQLANGPPPTVTSTAPSSLGQGAASQNVTVTGTNFVSGAAASFSGTGITVNSTSFVDSSHVTANVSVATSATIGSRDVTVTDPGGASGSCTGCFSVSAGPTVSSTSPSSLGQGATAQNVTVVGANFASGAIASFSGTGITVNSTTFVDGGHLTANVTISASAPAGARNVTVTNPGGGGSGSCSGCFSVTSVVKAPTITSFSPSKGRVGAAVTINGTNFTGVTFVYFNGTPAVFQTVSATRITAIVPAGATTGKISVVAAGGTASSTNSFRVR